MDAAIRREAARLRALGSQQAASYIIANYRTAWAPTFILIRRLSWKVADQMRLAEHFLPKKPFAHSSPYEAFASFMSVEHFLAAIERVWPEDEWDRDLLMYHLGPILENYAASEKGRSAVDRFLSTHST